MKERLNNFSISLLSAYVDVFEEPRFCDEFSHLNE